MIELVRYPDLIQPFMLHNSVVRGRMVRLDDALGAILSRHAYPEVVSRTLGELLVLGAMLSANLPEGGILTLQIKGNGLIPLMVVDVQEDGSIRGYATLPEEDSALREALAALPASTTLPELFGTGYLAITLDTPHGEPYQGIVPLEGASLSEAMVHYFTQSQQLDVIFHLVVSRRSDEEGTPRWIAGGIMLERMPDFQGDFHVAASLTPDAESWEYQSLLARTASEAELSDPYLAPSALLYRLFNEGGVWVYDTKAIKDQCRCSREKVRHVLEQLPIEDISSLYDEQGVIVVTCQFCSRAEIFKEGDLG